MKNLILLNPILKKKSSNITLKVLNKERSFDFFFIENSEFSGEIKVLRLDIRVNSIMYSFIATHMV